MAYQAQFVRNQNVPTTKTPLVATESDEKLPEDVDFSEGGWATDGACALLAIMFFISSFSYDTDNKHFIYMMFGTFLAHFFGGFAHRFYPNRASDGVGMHGFYVSMIIGYGGNCMRYGLGWGLGGLWPVISLLNFVYLLVTGIITMCTMKATTEVIDSSSSSGFKADTFFGYGELFSAAMEIIATIYFVATVDSSTYAVVAALANLTGWISVYAIGIWARLSGSTYDPSLMQRVFHYSMLVMLWAINERASSA